MANILYVDHEEGTWDGVYGISEPGAQFYTLGSQKRDLVRDMFSIQAPPSGSLPENKQFALVAHYGSIAGANGGQNNPANPFTVGGLHAAWAAQMLWAAGPQTEIWGSYLYRLNDDPRDDNTLGGWRNPTLRLVVEGGGTALEASDNEYIATGPNWKHNMAGASGPSRSGFVWSMCVFRAKTNYPAAGATLEVWDSNGCVLYATDSPAGVVNPFIGFQIGALASGFWLDEIIINNTEGSTFNGPPCMDSNNPGKSFTGETTEGSVIYPAPERLPHAFDERDFPGVDPITARKLARKLNENFQSAERQLLALDPEGTGDDPHR